ncbi:hypothetical protein THIOM_004472 [Candidatus Thiomargarita nelsonii]|uniref:Uncharacterized protein n=1 Tax=Candidatus Thiomargarita nelsonii TaxID=1003181 RepID=A0A176RVW9_9GAMM|nr:hypothetical protein THIOM_004472 [Candidatus Thiomargarita nelsonii]
MRKLSFDTIKNSVSVKSLECLKMTISSFSEFDCEQCSSYTINTSRKTTRMLYKQEFLSTDGFILVYITSL